MIACIVSVARAGVIATAPAPAAYYPQPLAYAAAPAPTAYASYEAPALTATSENVYRSPGNLNSISTQTKSISTPFSSSNKHFTSITNPGVYTQASYLAPAAYAHAPAAYPAPTAYAHAPAYAPAPIAPAVQTGSSLLGVAYSPAVAVSHMSYSSPFGVYSY